MSGRGISRVALAAGVVAALAVGLASPAAADEDPYEPISGSGSTWAQNALDQWRVDVASRQGLQVNYHGVGSTVARRDFIEGTVDFAVSDLPFQIWPEDGSPPEVPPRGYAYLPIVAGGTAFMYHLDIDGKPVTDLRLSGEVITKIFTGVITNWGDPQIQADNPGLAMPDKAIVPVVRSDGSGSSAQFSLWMSKQHGDIWTAGQRSQFPVPENGKAQKGSDGVSGYVSQNYGEGAITYVENSYALEAGFPVAKVLNSSGHYVAPTGDAVSIALLGARADAGGEQQLDGVYRSADPRAYPVSAYSYLIVPTETGGVFTAQRGRSLGEFATYAVCAGQGVSNDLGYAPLPINLVEDAARAIARIPGAAPLRAADCRNPTFVEGDTPTSNRLLANAPLPSPEDRRPGTATESNLKESNRTLRLDLVAGGPRVRVDAGAAQAGKTLHVGAFPGAVDLGRVTLDGGGAGEVDLSGARFAPASAVRLYLAESDGSVVAWNSLAVPPEGFPIDAGTNLSATVAVSGRFDLQASLPPSIDFGGVRRGAQSPVQQLGRMTVVDDRDDLVGWGLYVSVEDFVAQSGSSKVVARSAVGMSPEPVDLPEGTVLGAPQAAGSASYPAAVAFGAPGTATTEAGATFDAGLTFAAPRNASAGGYRSTLTVTLVSQ